MKLKYALIAYILIIAVCGYGWVMNIIKLIAAANFAGMEIARAIGIFVAPFGVVLGYL